MFPGARWAFMNSIQIGSETRAPSSTLAECDLFVVSHPDAHDDLRVEPDEPGVGVLVQSWWLARAPVPRSTTPRIELTIDVGRVGPDRVTGPRPVLFEDLTFTVKDPLDLIYGISYGSPGWGSLSRRS